MDTLVAQTFSAPPSPRFNDEMDTPHSDVTATTSGSPHILSRHSLIGQMDSSLKEDHQASQPSVLPHTRDSESRPSALLSEDRDQTPDSKQSAAQGQGIDALVEDDVFLDPLGFYDFGDFGFDSTHADYAFQQAEIL